MANKYIIGVVAKCHCINTDDLGAMFCYDRYSYLHDNYTVVESLAVFWIISCLNFHLCDVPLPLAQPQRLSLDTPLHFSAKYKLIQLFSQLLTLPGVLQALGTPNEEGFLPLDLARESGCEEIVYLIAE